MGGLTHAIMEVQNSQDLLLQAGKPGKAVVQFRLGPEITGTRSCDVQEQEKMDVPA